MTSSRKDEPCLRASCQFVPCVITIDHHVLVCPLSKRWQGIRWNGLLDIPIEFLPIVMLKSGVINMRASGVKNKSRVVLQPEIAYHMESCVKVSFPRVR